MATFANATYNAANYAAFRPVYPPLLFKVIIALHGPSAPRNAALDLGCGTGQVTEELPAWFATVYGADPSRKMISEAKRQTKNQNIHYLMSPAEDIASNVPEGIFDLVTAGQSAHWYDHKRVWKSLAKALRPGGMLAFWGYADFRIRGHPELTQDVLDFSYSDSIFGPYWEQPGRNILANYFRDVPFPASDEWDVSSGRRIYFIGDHVPELGHVPYVPLTEKREGEGTVLPNTPEECRTGTIMGRKMTWEGMASYLRTWSPYHRYLEQNPEERSKTGKGKDGDVVDRFIERLREKVSPEEREHGVEVEWPMVLLVLKKKA